MTIIIQGLFRLLILLPLLLAGCAPQPSYMTDSEATCTKKVQEGVALDAKLGLPPGTSFAKANGLDTHLGVSAAGQYAACGGRRWSQPK